ncbi:MAG: DNA replication/repair protein RecF [Defluviitaleaceae bacterium]|nr:DNA replication/repair protein RecF [Defluviitaleaceae bacterium]
MYVSKLSLENFRNFEILQVDLENGINIVYGDNANGKTNFIEAIYLCATGRSQRAGHDRELVRFGQKEAHLQAVVESEGSCKIDVHLFKEGKKKGIAVDHISIKKLNQLFGLLLIVIFTPEDLKIVKAGPAERRAFMDLEMCQLSSLYYHAIRRYHQALKQRNNLLKAISKDRSLQDTLDIWDEPLCEYGTQIMDYRADFIKEVAGIANSIHNDITAGKEELTLTYRPHIAEKDQYSQRLKRSVDRDIIMGSTTAGIHKDDIIFNINGNDVRTYGSQGQQRTAALSVKLAEVELIKSRTGNTPVLLLDDVLSELDENRQKFLFEHIGEMQTVLTCTGVEDVLKKISGAGKVMKMVNGSIL